MKFIPAPRTQDYLLRFHAGDVLPDSLIVQLRELQVTGGWLRLSGVLSDVELAAFSSEIEGPGGTKRIAGPIQAVVLDGSLGVANGSPSVDLRVVLARETDRALETIAGQLLRARVLGLDGSMTILAETVVPRALDKTSGVSLLLEEAVVHSAPPPPAPSSAASPSPPASWSDAVAASASSPPTAARPLASPLARPTPRTDDSDEGPYPQAGDHVDHFAFGNCEVLKSDGDRLHVRMKDGRIREIALEMLRVTALPPDGSTQRYKLSRKT